MLSDDDNTIVKFAGFWKRFAAYMIDKIILSLILPFWFIPMILFLSLGDLFNGDYSESIESVSQQFFFDDSNTESIYFLYVFILFVLVFGVIVEWLYFSIFESSVKRATPGKMILGIEVTDLTGNRISFARATGRYFSKILSSLFFMIGYLMAGFTERKQALHDFIASTLVLEKQPILYKNIS